MLTGIQSKTAVSIARRLSGDGLMRALPRATPPGKLGQPAAAVHEFQRGVDLPADDGAFVRDAWRITPITRGKILSLRNAGPSEIATAKVELEFRRKARGSRGDGP